MKSNIGEVIEMFAGKHISIEGMDGVGKTTVCKLLSERTGYVFLDKPLRYLFDEEGGDIERYFAIRDYVNKQSDRIFTSWFYGLSSTFTYSKYNGSNIITDRHFLSNYLWSGEPESEPVIDLLVKLLGAPTFTFLIYADKEQIIDRIRKRDIEDTDIVKAEKTEFAYKKMESFLIKYNMAYEKIDTSTIDPETVCNKIVLTLKSRGIIQ